MFLHMHRLLVSQKENQIAWVSKNKIISLADVLNSNKETHVMVPRQFHFKMFMG